ncbi:MAG: diadenylate cyclase [Nitrospinota bacterium]
MDGTIGGLLARIPWSQALDIGVMWFLLYQVYTRFQGTQALRLLVRVFLVWLAYLAAQAAGLVLTSFLLWALWLAGLLLFLVNFQGEIRRIVMQLRPVSRLWVILARARRVGLPEESVEAVAEAAFALARRGTGAILVLGRRDPVAPLLRSPGEEIGAEVRPALLETLFLHGAPYHDGAVLIQGGRLQRAGCVLPLSENAGLPAFYGTRHRAAAGITEASDALAVVVSEERGEVSAAEEGRFRAVESATELAGWLSSRLRAGAESPRRRRLLRGALLANWRPKAVTLAAAGVLWLVSAGPHADPRGLFDRIGPGAPEAEESYTAPVAYYGLPPGLALGGTPPASVRVRLRARRDTLNFMDAGRLRVSVSLAGLAEGPARVELTARNLDLPAEVRLAGFEPRGLSLQVVRSPAPRTPPAK